MPIGAKSPRRLRVWPAIVWPLGATLLFLGGGALFINKIASDQEKADVAALRLESYARLEAGELAARAGALARSFVENRLQERARQEKNRRMLLRGVMEGVRRVLGAGLEKSRNAASALRDVGEFPAGFEGLRAFLELAGPSSARGDDAALTALRACAPELAALLPSGCSLTVVENNFEELLSLGGGSLPEGARVESLSREFIWGEGAESRHWTLQVALGEVDQHPYPDAAELGAYLTEQFARVTLDDTAWAGWLVNRAGKPVAAFAAPDGTSPAAQGAPLPFMDVAEEWIELDDRRLAWMSGAERIEQVGLTPAVAVAIDRPPPPLVPAAVFVGDLRWSSFLSAFALLSLGLWIWFARAMFAARHAASSRRAVPPAAEKPAGRPASPASAQAFVSRPAPDRRLVRTEARDGGVPSGGAGLIVADIDAAGEVHVEAVPLPVAPAQPKPDVPSGSLLRLQERHRGGKGRRGSRVLDHASSPLLRQLAARVRPVVKEGAAAAAVADRRPAGRATEKIAPMKSPEGWDKVS